MIKSTCAIFFYQYGNNSLIMIKGLPKILLFPKLLQIFQTTNQSIGLFNLKTNKNRLPPDGTGKTITQ